MINNTSLNFTSSIWIISFEDFLVLCWIMESCYLQMNDSNKYRLFLYVCMYDVLGSMYLWHEQQEYHLRYDAYKRPWHDQHHLCPRGSRSKNPNPWCQTKRGGNGQDWRPTYLQNWDSWKDPIWNFRQVINIVIIVALDIITDYYTQC